MLFELWVIPGLMVACRSSLVSFMLMSSRSLIFSVPLRTSSLKSVVPAEPNLWYRGLFIPRGDDSALE